MTIHPGSFDSTSPDAVGAVSKHSAESWHGSGRQSVTCHPLALLPLRSYLHAPLTSPVLSLLTGTWKRTSVPNDGRGRATLCLGWAVARMTQIGGEKTMPAY